ncbi:hypothetical protein HG535_0B07090 [Zygotorulaspora mrakii]|uniref:Uncharacterized protein n=1 Tax=Zygotorulaspora mrakii TaxID=42260 RepID=A0A7H9B1L4_ZYGMR|nr:uncharacterized protein HG535_0B07090 [Zygotorulaspora mrakii]QLG71662.1 hypothetical protein HG535_0B07090 [Zygotorulaspora mrakii]
MLPVLCITHPHSFLLFFSRFTQHTSHSFPSLFALQPARGKKIFLVADDRFTSFLMCYENHHGSSNTLLVHLKFLNIVAPFLIHIFRLLNMLKLVCLQFYTYILFQVWLPLQSAICKPPASICGLEHLQLTCICPPSFDGPALHIHEKPLPPPLSR